MRFVKSLFIVLAAVFVTAVAREAGAQQLDPYVSCVKCHALPVQQAQAQMGGHGYGYPPAPEMACGMCHDTYFHEQNPNEPVFARYLLSPNPIYGPASYLTNFCTICHADHHEHKFDELGNPLLEAMPYGPPSALVPGAPTSVLPLFDPWGTAVQDPNAGGMVCSTCHDPHEPSYPYGQYGTPKFLRVGSTANINQLCNACHDTPSPSDAAPDLVIPSRSNGVSFAAGPVGDQQVTVTVKNRGNAFFPGGTAQVTWFNEMGYPMPIGSFPLPPLSPEQEETAFFGWMPPPDWTAGEGFYVFSLPPSGLLQGVVKDFVRAMDVTPVPTNLRVVAEGSTGIELAWDPPAPGPDMVSWDVYRDGVKVNASPLYAPMFFDGMLAPESPHLYAVVAVVGGLASEKSAPVVGTTTVGIVIDVPRDVATIQAAIDAASIGASIHVAPGTYTEPFSFMGKFGITVKGQDANGCILDYSANPGAIIDLGPATYGNTVAGFTIREAQILMYPGDVLFGCVVQGYNMPPLTYSAVFAVGGLAAQCVFDAPFAAAEIPPGGFFAAVNTAFLYAMPLWHPGTPPSAAALLVNNSFDGWPQYVEYQGSGNFTNFPAFDYPGPPSGYFTLQSSGTTDRGVPLGPPDTFNGPAPDVGVFEVGRPYTPQPPSGLTATFEPGPVGYPGSVRLDWMPSVDAPPRVQYYHVYRGADPFFPPVPETPPYAVIPAWYGPMIFIDADVAPGIIYYYEVRANAGPAFPPSTGELLSAPTNTASAGELNRAPLAADDAIQILEDQLTVVPVLENDVDPDGDALTIAGVGQPLNGVASVNPDNTVTYAPQPSFSGTDLFPYTVTDGRGGFATATVYVEVTHRNRPPVAVDDAYTIAEDATLDVPRPGVLANDSDPDSAPLYAYLVAGPSHGNLMHLTFGDFVYVPNQDFAGTDSFTYHVSDGSALSGIATVTITVTPVNDAPVAQPQSVTTAEDTALPLVLTASDPEGNPLTYWIQDAPAHGRIVGGANLSYVPDANYHGPDSFTFTANDGALHSAPATVTVTVTPVNDPPQANDDTAATAAYVPVLIAVLGNDTDLDGHTLTVSSATPGANGSAAVQAGGSILYTPNPGFIGTDAFSYAVDDGNGGSDTAAVTVSVRPQRLRITALTMATVTSGRYTSAKATPLAVDEAGAPLAGVSVGGRWSGLTSDVDTGLTGGDGKMTVSSNQVRNANGIFTFTIDAAAKAGYELDGSVSVLTNSVQYPAPPPPGGAMHVASIVMGLKTGKTTSATATVAVVDTNGVPVASAAVSGSWSGAVGGTSTGTTGADGKVTLSSAGIKNAAGKTFSFTVTGIAKGGWTYDPAANVETGDSITAP